MEGMKEIDELRTAIRNYLFEIKGWAGKIVEGLEDSCKRKSVGCALFRIDYNPRYLFAQAHNGPSRRGHVCSNEVGNCGCSHAEPRAVMLALRCTGKYKYEGVKLLCLCQYSPCTTCANVLIDSGLICGCIYETLTEHDKRGERFLSEVMPVFPLEQIMLGEERALAALKQWCSISSER